MNIVSPWPLQAPTLGQSKFFPWARLIAALSAGEAWGIVEGQIFVNYLMYILMLLGALFTFSASTKMSLA